MKNLEIKQMANLQGGASWDCWGMFAGMVVGAVGAPLAPFLAAGMLSTGYMYIMNNC